MKKISIIHFNPLELYPPVLNLINTLSNDKTKVQIISTKGFELSLNKFSANSKHIKIFRIGYSGKAMNPIVRFTNYCLFHLMTFFHLLYFRPHSLLYYETLSCLPALIYKKLVRKNVRLFIHYHEYTSSEERIRAGLFLRIFQKMEAKMYASACWISHINDIRLQQFRFDHSISQLDTTRILCNFPPESWYAFNPPEKNNIPLRLVYVGSIGMDMMFTAEVAKWVKQMEGIVTWDIYAVNIDKKLISFFNELSARNINLKGYVDYYNLPMVLKNYDVGLVLYKGIIPNHLYVTPNKLFEYHACGLDVWFPDKLLGCIPYITKQTYPKICALDFESLNEVNIAELKDRSNFSLAHQKYACERELQTLIHELEK